MSERMRSYRDDAAGLHTRQSYAVEGLHAGVLLPDGRARWFSESSGERRRPAGSQVG